MPICAKLADHPRYYRNATSSVPSSFTSDNPQCTSTSNIFPEISTSEVRPIIPTDSEQNKGDDNEKKDNEEARSNNESNCDKESEEDKDRPEIIIDLDVEMLNDIALWSTTLTDLMVDYIIRKKPNNIGNIETLKSVYKDRDQVYYRGLSYDHFYRKKINGVKEERNWLIFSETSKAVYCYPCKLFSATSSKLLTGFQNWKIITATLSGHEISKEHILAMCTLYK
ncbi:TTF-type domain-containing protein, partial [Trichonephila clavata]